MTIKLGLVGTGTVGGGCIDILQKHKEDFKRHYGIDVELVRVCSRDPEQAEAHGVSDLFTLDYHDIVNDPDIDIVIELIGGTTVARDVVVSALEAGKNVVTANKALMATHGEEVMHLAEKMNRELAFEASVGGGIPIIDPLKHSLISNEITSVMGIVNGTTNYMPRSAASLRPTPRPTSTASTLRRRLPSWRRSPSTRASRSTTCTPRASATSRRSIWTPPTIWAMSSSFWRSPIARPTASTCASIPRCSRRRTSSRP